MACQLSPYSWPKLSAASGVRVAAGGSSNQTQSPPPRAGRRGYQARTFEDGWLACAVLIDPARGPVGCKVPGRWGVHPGEPELVASSRPPSAEHKYAVLPRSISATPQSPRPCFYPLARLHLSRTARCTFYSCLNPTSPEPCPRPKHDGNHPSHRRSYTQEEWDAKRSDIAQLYRRRIRRSRGHGPPWIASMDSRRREFTTGTPHLHPPLHCPISLDVVG